MTNGATGGAGDTMRDRGKVVGRYGGATPKAGISSQMQKAIDISKGNTESPAPDVQAALAANGACTSFANNRSRIGLCTKAGFTTQNTSGFPDADVKAETLFDGPQADSSRVLRKLTYAPGDSNENSAIEAFCATSTRL